MGYPHQSVLLNEFLSAFSETSIRTFIDGTLGAGGHTEAILTAHPEIEQLIGIDQDPIALEIASKRLEPFSKKVTLLPGNFRDVDFLIPPLVKRVDGIFLDLGVSSMQLDRAERGMSFSKEGPLDMRMNPESALTAEEIVNRWSQEDLEILFRDYGEEPKWRFVAAAVVKARQEKVIRTTKDLVALLSPILYRKTRKNINPMTLIFQALRIAVNQELEALSLVIPKLIDLLAPQGRLGIISFHSLEDRIVKQAFRKASGYLGGRIEGIDLPSQEEPPLVRLITKRPIVPSEEEEEMNPRSRSAKLRVLEKL